MSSSHKNKVLYVERIPSTNEWDHRAKKALDELPIFYSEWMSEKSIQFRTSELYWILLNQNDNEEHLKQIIQKEILSDPFQQIYFSSISIDHLNLDLNWYSLEKFYKPGVTDNTANAFSEVLELVLNKKYNIRSGLRYWVGLEKNSSIQNPFESIVRYSKTVFYNELIECCEVKSKDEILKLSKQYQHPNWIDVNAGMSEPIVHEFDFREMSVSQMKALSDQSLWALSEDECLAIQNYFKKMNKKCTDVEIEVLAQTWSEHCKHKIFSADINIVNDRNDVELPHTVKSLFKTYIKGATEKIKSPFLCSVFDDNAGIIQITDKIKCAIKVETHNSPSALDPYGGSLTGIVGVNRDILGAGLGAKPIANLDVFCVGPLDYGKNGESLPAGLHHPKRILDGVRTGIEHGGNKSGIPTVTGAIVHHDHFLGKPLVFCGTIGLIPGGINETELIDKKILPGDLIIVSGGRVGKDGIHGATFSSLEMNENSPVSAVQLGDPLTQKRVSDFLLEARDKKLFRAVTDNGAGGLSSSIGELARLCGNQGGAELDVGLCPVKYPGLQPFELTVSESQERMSFAVAPENKDAFLELSILRGVESTVLGKFVDSGYFHILFKGKTVGKLEMQFLHDGVPKMKLNAHVKNPDKYKKFIPVTTNENLEKALVIALAHPNVRTRRPVIEKYDHEVQARTIQKPYGSPNRMSPNDGGALVLNKDSFEGIAVGLGLAPSIVNLDVKAAAECSVDEAIRNTIAAGGDPEHMVLVDNFCWPDPMESQNNPDAKDKCGALVLTCERIYNAAIKCGIPFVSGKDSMKNDYRMNGIKISVPPTVLITAMAKIQNTKNCPLNYFSDKYKYVYWISGQEKNDGLLKYTSQNLPVLNFIRLKEYYKKLHALIMNKTIGCIHDVSDGGWLVATSEMLFGTGLGLNINISIKEDELFLEPAASFVISTNVDLSKEFEDYFCKQIGTINHTGELQMNHAKWKVKDLEVAYGHSL